MGVMCANGEADHGLMGWLVDVREELGLGPLEAVRDEKDVD